MPSPFHHKYPNQMPLSLSVSLFERFYFIFTSLSFYKLLYFFFLFHLFMAPFGNFSTYCSFFPLSGQVYLWNEKNKNRYRLKYCLTYNLLIIFVFNVYIVCKIILYSIKL